MGEVKWPRAGGHFGQEKASLTAVWPNDPPDDQDRLNLLGQQFFRLALDLLPQILKSLIGSDWGFLNRLPEFSCRRKKFLRHPAGSSVVEVVHLLSYHSMWPHPSRVALKAMPNALSQTSSRRSEMIRSLLPQDLSVSFHRPSLCLIDSIFQPKKA